MMMTIGKKLGLVLASLLVASTATAEPGDGITAGNLTVQPGITLLGGFDSNVFFLSNDENGVLSSPSLKVTPFLNLNSAEPDLINFTLNSSVGWQQYLSPSDDIIQGQSGLDANIDLGVGINEKGTFSIKFEDALQRTNEPPYSPSSDSFDRTINRAGVTLGFHPGGRVFQHYLSYDWTLNLNDQVPDIDRQLHDFTLRNYWKFLPKTAFVLTGDLGFVNYSQSTRSRGDRDYANIGSMPLRITGGMTGLITNRLSLNLIGGWGFGFYDQGSSFSGFLADLRATYSIGSTVEKSRIYIGYERQFNDATIANFSSWHKPYLGYEQGFANRRLRLNVRGELLFRNYEEVFSGLHNVGGGQLNIPADLSDALFRLKAGANFNITKWFSSSLNYNLTSNFTDDRLDASGSAKDSLRAYTRHFVGLGLTFKY